VNGERSTDVPPTTRFDTFSPPPVEPDPWATTAAAADVDDGELDPRAAAALLERTKHEAQRAFEVDPVLLMLVGAATVVVAFGAVWLSVRHQHPYSGPSGAGLGVLYGVIAVWSVFLVAVRSRAVSGVGGRAARERRAAGIAFALVWVAVYVFQGALHHAGAGRAVVYGIYPATAPLLVVGGAAAAYSAARDDRAELLVALAAVALGAGAAFAGPRTVWLAVGVGLAAILLAVGAVRTGRRRARA
jgi:hypothetical protein